MPIEIPQLQKAIDLDRWCRGQRGGARLRGRILGDERLGEQHERNECR
jgi:hypothetical protein